MDQLNQQVARARRRLVVQQFANWLVWCLLVIAAVATVATVANADEQIVTSPDTKVVVKVTKEDDQFMVEVAGGELRFSFSELTTTVANPIAALPADQLLLRGLESQLLYGNERLDIGLLAEAYRLAPNDVRVAFWYARTLTAAGMGKAAGDVFDRHRKEIAATYPGLVDQLAEQINRRKKLEELPVGLLQQIDAVRASEGDKTALLTDKELRAAFFQLVDQHGVPVDAAAFQISCNGQNERLQSFDAGYHLFTYLVSRNSNQSPCRLEIKDAKIQEQTIEFTGTTGHVDNAGKFEVKMFGDEDLRTLLVKVLGERDEPITGASVTIYPSNNRRRLKKTPTAKTNDLGRTEIQLYPGEYTCRTSFAGYTLASEKVDIELDSREQRIVQLKLHRLLPATVKVQWRAKVIGPPHMPLSSGEEISLGEEELHNGNQAVGTIPQRSAVPWVRLRQEGDQLQLQFIEQPTYGPMGVAGGSWVGQVGAKAGAAEDFEAIDLASIDEWRNKVDVLRLGFQTLTSRSQPSSVSAEKGAIFIGQVNGRDIHGRYPQRFSFKILVTEWGGSVDSQVLEKQQRPRE